MKDKIQFSIIIPAHNEEDHIADCIRCAQSQKGDFGVEIIVVNNASTDKTESTAESMGVLVIDEPRKGVGRARKTGTEVARGDLILHIDADTHLPEDYLIQVKKRFDNDSKLVCVGGQFYFYDANLFWYLLRPVLFPVFYLFAKLSMGDTVGPMGNNMVFKKSAYNKVGGFDASLNYGEDFDLNRKLSKIGRVRLDMKLKYFISARRYNLFQKGFWIYVANFFSFCLKKDVYKNELSKSKTKSKSKSK